MQVIGSQLLEVRDSGLPRMPLSLGHLDYSATTAASDVCLVLQTVSALHQQAFVAHMNISSSCVLVNAAGTTPWDQVRLVEYVYARHLVARKPACHCFRACLPTLV